MDWNAQNVKLEKFLKNIKSKSYWNSWNLSKNTSSLFIPNKHMCIDLFLLGWLMSKRVTIMIDDDLDKKLRLRQAKIIQQEQSSCSYSKVVNDVLRKVLK